MPIQRKIVMLLMKCCMSRIPVNESTVHTRESRVITLNRVLITFKFVIATA